MSPAAKLSPTRATPASDTARTNASASRLPGTGASNGHQNSTARNPACLAAAGRCSSGSSVNRIEQLTANRGPAMAGTGHDRFALADVTPTGLSAQASVTARATAGATLGSKTDGTT